MNKTVNKYIRGCANCNAPAADGSTLCSDCLAASVSGYYDAAEEIAKEKDTLILALKAACKGRGILICKLANDCVKKDEEISKLKDRIEFLEKWARWNKGKEKS